MVIETHTIAIWTDGNTAGEPSPPQLMDALGNFAKSRATRSLIREGLDRDVKCSLRVPLLDECRVRPDELGRALRKVWRAALDAGKAGDQFIIDLYIGPDYRLVVQVARGTVL